MRVQKGINNSKVRDVLRNHGAGTYILQVLEKAKLYSFSSHPFSISMRVGSAPSSASIIHDVFSYLHVKILRWNLTNLKY
jgi:hypothetical protein